VPCQISRFFNAISAYLDDQALLTSGSFQNDPEVGQSNRRKRLGIVDVSPRLLIKEISSARTDTSAEDSARHRASGRCAEYSATDGTDARPAQR
jgi:hypothetical protein